MSERVPQYCVSCNKIDVYPRHTTYDINTNEALSKHFDCCAATGCEVCVQVLAGIPEDSRTGDALIAYLTGA